MFQRWGLGPVYVYESMLNARRWQVYAVRSLFALSLLVGMAFVWLTSYEPSAAGGPGGRLSTLRNLALVGEGFFYALTGIQLSLVLLVAPTATAGSINTDRARGLLRQILATDLSDAEIVLGKLAARLAPVAGLIACGVPVMAVGALLGGVDFGALLGSFVVSLALAVLACSLALTFSIWVPKMHEVLMGVYAMIGIWLLALPVWWRMSFVYKALMPPPDWFQKANPYVLVFAPYNQPGLASAGDFAVFAGVALALSAALVGLSIARLRAVVIGAAGRTEKAARRRWPELKSTFPSWPAPTLDGNPVLWCEWHRNRPSKLARRLWALLLLSSWGLAASGTYGIVTNGWSRGPNALATGLLIDLLFGTLLLSATAPTALAEERVRGSLDVLLATPLSTASIVAGKWWGAYRRVFVLALLHLYTGVFLAAVTPDAPSFPVAVMGMPPPIPLTLWDRVLAPVFCAADFLVSGALIVSVGVALSTWMRRLGRAVGLSVGFFFLSGIGWLIAGMWVSNWLIDFYGPPDNRLSHLTRQCVTALSPVFGPIAAVEELEVRSVPHTDIWDALGPILALKAMAAAVLFALTVRTFDLCLDRMPERGSRIRTRRKGSRRAKPKATGAEVA